MTCEECTCAEIPESIRQLSALFSKLGKAKFTGTLNISFEGGNVSSAELRHYLPFAELGRDLPTVMDYQESIGASKHLAISKGAACIKAGGNRQSRGEGATGQSN